MGRSHVYIPTKGNGLVAQVAVLIGLVLLLLGTLGVFFFHPTFWEGMGWVLFPATLVAVSDRTLRVILLQMLGVTPHHLGLHR